MTPIRRLAMRRVTPTAIIGFVLCCRFLFAQSQSHQSSESHAAGGFAQADVPSLIAALKGRDAAMRLSAIHKLEQTFAPNPQVVAPALIGALNDTDARVRSAAAFDLG